MVESLHDQIERERLAAQPSAKDAPVYRDYARGQPGSTLTPEQKEALNGLLKHTFSDNVCNTVMTAWADRLIFEGWQVEDEGVHTFLEELWTKNQLPALAYDVAYATARDGNHAVMLRWLNADAEETPENPDADLPEAPLKRAKGRVTLHAENWWDGKQGIWVAYDDVGRPAYAVKDFFVMMPTNGGKPKERKRRNIYYPDRIARYIQESQGWAPYPLEGEPPTGVVPWLDRDGKPLGIPVMHFQFPRFGTRLYGESQLAGGLLALQDQINEIQLDMCAAARILGFPILTGTGVTFDTPPSVEPGTMLYSSDSAAKFGAIPAGDMSQLATALETKLLTVARTTSTPIHIIKNDWPAGVALIEASQPLISLVRRMGHVMGPTWASAAHSATEMSNAFANTALNTDTLITTIYSDPEQRTMLQQMEIDLKRAQVQAAIELLHDEESLLAMGLTQEQVKKRLADRKKRQEEQMAMESVQLDEQAERDAADEEKPSATTTVKRAAQRPPVR